MNESMYLVLKRVTVPAIAMLVFKGVFRYIVFVQTLGNGIFQGTTGCTPNSVPMVFSWCSLLGGSSQLVSG